MKKTSLILALALVILLMLSGCKKCGSDDNQLVISETEIVNVAPSPDEIPPFEPYKPFLSFDRSAAKPLGQANWEPQVKFDVPKNLVYGNDIGAYMDFMKENLPPEYISEDKKMGFHFYPDNVYGNFEKPIKMGNSATFNFNDIWFESGYGCNRFEIAVTEAYKGWDAVSILDCYYRGNLYHLFDLVAEDGVIYRGGPLPYKFYVYHISISDDTFFPFIGEYPITKMLALEGDTFESAWRREFSLDHEKGLDLDEFWEDFDYERFENKVFINNGQNITSKTNIIDFWAVNIVEPDSPAPQAIVICIGYPDKSPGIVAKYYLGLDFYEYKFK